MSFLVGETARLDVRFADADGNGTNPTTVALSIQAPDNTTSSPAPVSDGAGVYHYDLALTQSGVYFFKWTGTGTVAAVNEGQLVVLPTELVNQPPEALPASSIINSAYRLINVMLAPGRGSAPEELTEGLYVLNAMLDAWKIERLTVYNILRTVTNVISGQQDYSIGLDGTPDISLERPSNIEAAGLILSGTTPLVEFPLWIWTPQLWESERVKTLTSTLPIALYYQPTIPNGTITLWPKPNQANQLALYTWQRLQRVQTLSTTLVLPPGYQQAIEYNLALMLYPRYKKRGALLDQTTQATAVESKANLKVINAPDVQMVNDFTSRMRGMRYDIFSDSYRQTRY